jgi:hypothetical protein
VQERALRQQETKELQALPANQRAQRREELKQQRDQRVQQRQPNQPTLQNQQAQTPAARAERRRNGAARVTTQAARQGRFAAQAQAATTSNRSARRAARFAARHAWARGLRAAFVPWYGPVFWPYAYSDIFDYTFWPGAYDDGYWAYAYDEMFDGVFWADGGPYADYAYAGPYATTGSAPAKRTVAELCGDAGKGITAWPFGEIEKAVQPTPEQKTLFANVKTAAAEAASAFKTSCAPTAPKTPPGRLQAMTQRIEATLEAVLTVRPALDAFYNSLSDEQKARFNSIGPENIGKDAKKNEAAELAKNCGEAKPGLVNLPIEQIEDSVKPTGEQQAALDRLEQANGQAADTLLAACPAETPLTPSGRLEATEKRLQAMLEAAKTLQPALDDFYASLSNEQKARFNTMTARSDG